MLAALIGEIMSKAIVVAVGDIPLNRLNDLLKQNDITTTVIDTSSKSADELNQLLDEQEQSQCVLIKGINTFQKLPTAIAATKQQKILLYSSPLSGLSHNFENSNDIKPQHLITNWEASLHEALQLVEKDSSLLLCDLDDILDNSDVFLAEIFAVQSAVDVKQPNYPKQLLANHLACIQLYEQDSVFALYDEALSIGKLFGEFTVHLGPDTEEIKSTADLAGKSVLQRLTDSNQEIQGKAARIHELQQQLNETETKLVETQASLEDIRLEKNQVEQALTEMSKTHKERVKELESHLESLKNTKQAFEENISELNDQLGQSKTLNKQQAEKLESLQQQLNSTNKKLKEATENKEQIVAEYDKRIEQAQQHSANLEKEQQEIVKELEKTLEATKQAKQQKDQELNKQADVVAEQNNQVAALKKKSAELQQVQENLQQQLESTNTKLKEATENKAQMVAEYDKRIM